MQGEPVLVNDRRRRWRSSSRFAVIVTLRLSVLGSIAACSPSDDDENSCIAITREYQEAMADALVCEPDGTDQCRAARPLVVSEVAEDGGVTLEGLCAPPCLAAINPDRTSTLDELLVRFDASGCAYQRCWCPPASAMLPACTDEGTCWGLGTGWPP
jgi:hypothetical protein